MERFEDAVITGVMRHGDHSFAKGERIETQMKGVGNRDRSELAGNGIGENGVERWHSSNLALGKLSQAVPGFEVIGTKCLNRTFVIPSKSAYSTYFQ